MLTSRDFEVESDVLLPIEVPQVSIWRAFGFVAKLLFWYHQESRYSDSLPVYLWKLHGMLEVYEFLLVDSMIY